jgi:hypothetical protein
MRFEPYESTKFIAHDALKSLAQRQKQRDSSRVLLYCVSLLSPTPGDVDSANSFSTLTGSVLVRERAIFDINFSDIDSHTSYPVASVSAELTLMSSPERSAISTELGHI